jgi:hypothetical protein
VVDQIAVLHTTKMAEFELNYLLQSRWPFNFKHTCGYNQLHAWRRPIIAIHFDRIALKKAFASYNVFSFILATLRCCARALYPDEKATVSVAVPIECMLHTQDLLTPEPEECVGSREVTMQRSAEAAA